MCAPRVLPRIYDRRAVRCLLSPLCGPSGILRMFFGEGGVTQFVIFVRKVSGCVTLGQGSLAAPASPQSFGLGISHPRHVSLDCLTDCVPIRDYLRRPAIVVTFFLLWLLVLTFLAVERVPLSG